MLPAEKLFDSLGQQYEDVYINNPALGQTIAAAVALLPSDAHVLDVGCGTGKPVSNRVAQAGHRVHGIDISSEMVKIASANVKGARFEKADMLTFQPPVRYDAIFAIFSMFQLTHSQTYRMMLNYCDWLKQGGVLVLGTIPATSIVHDSSLYDRTGTVVRHADLIFMGHHFTGTVYTTAGWHELCRKCGLEIVLEKSASFACPPPYEEEVQDHYFLIARKVVRHALMAPYPLPCGYRGPHPLSEGAWAPFAERLVRDEFDAVLEVLKDNRRVLDVGTYSVEPNADRNQIQTAAAGEKGITIRAGSAEAIPFASGFFDAAVAMWILHYVQDLEQSLREIARVVDPAAPDAKLVIVQGAPDNELVNLLNEVCAPLSAANTAVDHQGFLLHEAARVFEEHGFGDIRIFRVNALCGFPEADPLERCEKAAAVLAGFWFLEDANLEEMKRALVPHLERQFRDRPGEVGDEVAVLVARPWRN
ncbi:hypothetical protein ASPACDRAFT_35955 [Aspergillus aculeatus ATCC 16872]|uniref:Methyltransferase type 11 domain-containing protein n=1 Tax=Aspergillus aculeatus (strain ATCC 16872 / CBS 172.66 / WB 5094) TaxID=690307 RepID=A0A1L9WHT9_ASPA1|nr:uncharacterized protein ASPACDRAFT_35955 [Aspergillus aculeatus ATCC 16872]OJJ95675.1 hypothetical protein ASPACDRAFT_35955 [Aspergillus aculeatus ATCC 16872]